MVEIWKYSAVVRSDAVGVCVLFESGAQFACEAIDQAYRSVRFLCKCAHLILLVGPRYCGAQHLITAADWSAEMFAGHWNFPYPFTLYLQFGEGVFGLSSIVGSDVGA